MCIKQNVTASLLIPLALYIKVNREWYYRCSGVWNFSLTIQLHIHKKVQWTSESLKWEENNSISPHSQFLYDLFHLWYQHELILVSCHSSWHQIEQMTCHMKSYCNFPCVEIWFFFLWSSIGCVTLWLPANWLPLTIVRTYLQHLWSLSGSPKF